MAKQQGKVVSIPVKEVAEGMQVFHPKFGIGKVAPFNEYEPKEVCSVLFAGDDSCMGCEISDLKTLVVKHLIHNRYLQDSGIPLKWSQWRMAIKKGEVDSDSIVEFEIVSRLRPDFEHSDSSTFFADPTHPLNKIQIAKIFPFKRAEFTPQECEAIRRFQNGERISTSTFIDEDTIVAGYGGLDGYDFKYPLPSVYIRQIFGSTSWNEVFKAEDLKREAAGLCKRDQVKDAISRFLDYAVTPDGNPQLIKGKLDEWFNNNF